MTPVEYLYSLELHGIKLGLDNIRRLLEAAGNPERAWPSVHVAGSNGKGSVLAFLDSILCAAGYKTGRFISPHLIDIRERFLAGRELIRRRDLEQHITFFRGIARGMSPPPTFFEMNTAVAFRHFAARNVEIALIEVGMGGRFDSTNVITPLATAITNISLEHTAYLGDTLEKIAGEKAGILKQDVPLVLTDQNPASSKVILKRARALNCAVRLLGRDFSIERAGDELHATFTYKSADNLIENVRPGLAGRYQTENAAAAIALVEALVSQFPRIDLTAVIKGLEDARWPCRIEKVLTAPPVYIDVAHNEAGAHVLATAMAMPCVVVLAVASEKNAAAMLQALQPITRRLIVTQFQNRRALPVAELARIAEPYGAQPEQSLPDAIEAGLALAGPECPLLVTGSLFTAGEARRHLMKHHGAPPLRF